jgi:hypothetical protein
MSYSEEKQFTLRFAIEARFDEEDDGAADGFAWLPEWEQGLKPAIVRAVFQVLRNAPGWEARARNRGAAADEEIEIVVTRKARGKD